MNQMYESHSKDCYDDDSGGGSPPIPLKEIPFFILLSVLAFLYITTIELLIPIGMLFAGFCSIANDNSKSGKLESPGLFITGILLVAILVALSTLHLFNVSDHRFLTSCSAIIFIYLTLAPLARLVMHHLKNH